MGWKFWLIIVLAVAVGLPAIFGLGYFMDSGNREARQRLRESGEDHPAPLRDLAALKDRIASLEKRVDELSASLDATRKELEDSRKESEQRGTALRLELEKEREKTKILQMLLQEMKSTSCKPLKASLFPLKYAGFTHHRSRVGRNRSSRIKRVIRSKRFYRGALHPNLSC